MRTIPVVLAALLLVSCSADTATNPTAAAQVAGTWVQREAVAGLVLVLDLDVRGATITGTGTYTVEDGRSGTLTATGTISDGTLRLATRDDTGEATQFVGEQVSDMELSGSLHLGPALSLTPAHIVTFDRRD